MSAGVLLVGDVIDDVLVRPEGPVQEDTDTPSRIERTAGGSAANTACWLAADGVGATLVAAVGAGDGDRCGDELLRAGVTPRLTEVAGRTTGAIVVLSQGDRRTMLTDRGANEAAGPELVTDDLLASHDLLHVTAHVFTGEDRDAGWRALLEDAGRAGLRRSVAPGSVGLLAAYGPARFRRLVAGVEVLAASEAEAALLTDEQDPAAAARVLARDHEVVAVTLGRRGALLRAGGRERLVAAVPAEPVDTTGAGDAWVAGLLGALVAGADPLVAGDAAARSAARAVSVVGARPVRPGGSATRGR